MAFHTRSTCDSLVHLHDIQTTLCSDDEAERLIYTEPPIVSKRNAQDINGGTVCTHMCNVGHIYRRAKLTYPPLSTRN